MKRPLLTALSLTLGALLALKVLLPSSNTIKPTSDKDLAKVSVMITNAAGNSGGSGVILTSGPTGSTVLTNQHVCGLAQRGLVRLHTADNDAVATSYKVSKMHDICLLSTPTDLGVSTVVANSPPKSTDAAIVVGHPALFPTIITRGNFTTHVTIPVMTGVRPCTDEELESDIAIVCIFMGGIPVIKLYDSQLVGAATIMAGSSGSPVFNSAGEISGLIFAGSGDLSYGFIVPWEYVANFVLNEVPKLESQTPVMELNIADMLGSKKDREADVQKLLEECRNRDVSDRVKKICRSLTRAIIN